jgi:hypothetical protein
MSNKENQPERLRKKIVLVPSDKRTSSYFVINQQYEVEEKPSEKHVSCRTHRSVLSMGGISRERAGYSTDRFLTRTSDCTADPSKLDLRGDS